MTTTPTSGAADLLAMVSKALREAYNLGQRYWQQADSEYISQHKKADDTRAKFLALVEETCAALAAGQATAAQQGAYAALSESFLEIPDVQDESGINAYYSREVVLECIDAALASHGQAPAGAGEPTEQQILEAAEKAGLWPNTVHSWIPAFHRYHKELAKAQPAQAAQADSVQEDAARYRWLRDQAHPDSEDSGIAVSESDFNDWGNKFTRYYSGEELDAAIDAARKQGASHDR